MAVIRYKVKSFVPVPAWITSEQKAKLKALSAASRISQQAHLREALDDLFLKYRKALKGAKR